MKEMNTTLPDSLSQKMLDNFTVNGAVPVTSTHLDSLCDSLLAEIRTRCTSQNAERIPTQEEQSTSRENAALHFWGGRHHLFPEGFCFPKGHVKMLWDLWWGGEPH